MKAWLDERSIEYDPSKEAVMGPSNSLEAAVLANAQEGESPAFRRWPNKFPVRRDLVGNKFFYEVTQTK